MNESQQYRDVSAKAIRERLIEGLASAKNKTDYAKIHSEDLMSLGLTVYSKDYSFDSLLYNSFAKSVLDNNISLHPEQLMVVDEISKNDAIILSAPTSFGKTFCVFEYIARKKPQNVVLVVPTLALVDEYRRKIIRTHANSFSNYKVYTNVLSPEKVNFDEHNIFIMTHDRIISGFDLNILKSIDFLVIDEVYKLNIDYSNDRVLVLNLAYYYLAQKATKYVLLAPFIKGILNANQLEKKPKFIRTNFSPVVNKIITVDILDDHDRFLQCSSIVESLKSQNQKTLIYFPTVLALYKYIDNIISSEQEIEITNEGVNNFIRWAKHEIHEKWAIVTALERGYLIHNGQLQLGTRIFLLDLFDDLNSGFNNLLCTSSLLEGVNTSAENIVITRPSTYSTRKGNEFTAFDFYNLVGRTGRLNKHYIGNAYYIKGPADPVFKLEDAEKTIKFEILDNSKDINVQLGIAQHQEKIDQFFKELNTNNDDYVKNVGAKLRIDNAILMYEIFKIYKENIKEELIRLGKNDVYGRYSLVKYLYAICNTKEIKSINSCALNSSILNLCLDLKRLNIHTIIDKQIEYENIKESKRNDIIKKYSDKITNNSEMKKRMEAELKKYPQYSLNIIIANTIKIKTSYVEHEFYNRCMVIRYFMVQCKEFNDYLSVFDKKILQPIEILYYTKDPLRKSLLDLGIYDKDVDLIVSKIGDSFVDVSDLKSRLINHKYEFNDVSFISSYVITRLGSK